MTIIKGSARFPHRRVECIEQVTALALAKLVVDNNGRSQAVLGAAFARQGGVDRSAAANPMSTSSSGEALDRDTRAQPRHTLDDGRHLIEDATSLPRRSLAAASRLPSAFGHGSSQVAERQGMEASLRLAIATTNTQHRRPHLALALLVGCVDGTDEIFSARGAVRSPCLPLVLMSTAGSRRTGSPWLHAKGRACPTDVPPTNFSGRPGEARLIRRAPGPRRPTGFFPKNHLLPEFFPNRN